MAETKNLRGCTFRKSDQGQETRRGSNTAESTAVLNGGDKSKLITDYREARMVRIHSLSKANQLEELDLEFHEA